MNRIFFVVFCILFSNISSSEPMKVELNKIESDWALAEHTFSVEKRKFAFQNLLKQAKASSEMNPRLAEPLILQACILLTRAKIESSLKALRTVKQAKTLLEKAITINPVADKGSAFVTLGVLYYKVPGWPIAFGDNQKAALMLKKALKINPKGIDTNYFYAEYLLSQNKPEKAVRYLLKAVNGPTNHTNKFFADEILTKARKALKDLSIVVASNDHKNIQ